MDFVATRNTCFALISSIEDDFRSLILALGDGGALGSDLLPTDVKDNALRRRASDLRMDAISSNVRDADLLPYIDFADIAKIVDAKLAPRNEPHKGWLNESSRRLLSLTAARNRVCHSRPLETDDLPKIVDFARSLVDGSTPFPFQSVTNAVMRLGENPGFVLTLQIPTFWQDKPRIHHNLPIPEFDDTGFVGRQSDRLNVLRLLASHYPIVTIVGEGGVGKTALAQRCLYDLLDDPSTPFDAIIWVTLKTAALTHSGIQSVTGAITSTLGLLSEVTRNLGPRPQPGQTEADLIDEVVEYLTLYRLIIVIDNLETLSAGPLRELMIRVPVHSKIFITSRVGVGEFEARYPLHGLDEKSAITLFRAQVRILAVKPFDRLDDGNIKGYCKRLFYNPLLIKWFVSSVGLGAEPGGLLSRGGETFTAALTFCFENLFDRLGAPEKDVISCLASARKPVTAAEIHFLMPDLGNLDAEVALSALHNSSIVIREKKGSDGFEYSLSESALAFVSTMVPPSVEFFKRTQDRLRELRLVLTQESILEARYEYDPFYVRSGEGRDERICATYLRKALDVLRRNDVANARAQVAEAKRLAPTSGEVWRISALVEESAGDLYRSFQEYENAIGLNPNSRISRYCFGMFLMTDMDELEGALAQLIYAQTLDPEAAPVLTAKAMALTRLGRFEESAAIHEQLLPTLRTRERRWRLTGADQAADCYRRWAHRLWDQKEYSQAKSYIKRAMAILLDSAERSDFDDKLLQRTARVLNEAFLRRELSDDFEFSEFCVTFAERISDLCERRSIPIASEMALALRNQQLPVVHRDRLEALDRSIQPARVSCLDEVVPLIGDDGEDRERNADDVHLGEVHNIQPGQRFGFLVGRDGARWFFHINFLYAIADWDVLETGTKVSFRVGQNSKGPCAIEVRVLA